MHSKLGRRLVFFGVLMSAASAIAGQRLDWGNDWRFTRGEVTAAETAAFDDHAWKPVDLPHDWSIAGPIARENPAGSPGGFFPMGVGWYLNTFDAPADWTGKRVSIEFDGVYMLSDVYINGHKLGTHISGFLPFD